MARVVDMLPDDVVYRVSVLVLREKQPMVAVTRWLRENGYPTAKREWPRQILGLAYDRGLIHMPIRQNFELGTRLQNASGAICRVAGVADRDKAAFDGVAALAAEQVVSLIRQVQLNGRENIDPPRNEVHIGLAAGGTSRAFAAHLAPMLRSEHDLPQLYLHTLSSGFFVENPDSAPVTSLGQFKDIDPKPEFVVLHAPPLVSQCDAPKLRTLPMIRDAYKAAGDLDIVVTSVSVAQHVHSLFRRAVEQIDPEHAERNLEILKRRDWAGDIMWQPYSEKGRPISSEVHAVSVVDFDRLVELSNSPAKHVVCIAGPCAACREPKDRAILPLLRRPKTGRPFSHLVTTESMAQRICKELGW